MVGPINVLAFTQRYLKARRIVGLLYGQFSNTSRHTIVTLYTSLVRLHLEYACPVWSPYLTKDINGLEKVQRFACRVALGNDQLLIRTGLPTLAARRWYLQQCCLFRIVHGYSVLPNGYVTVRAQPIEMTLRSLNARYISASPLLGWIHIFIHSSEVQSPTGTHYLLT